jgi:glycosyltransferase involved in cell wall biosynthesis
LCQMKKNRASRQRMGAAGRERVEERYCLQVTASRWMALLQDLYSDGLK